MDRGMFDVLMDELRMHGRDVAAALTAPHVLMRPELSVDGNMYCFLFGRNLQEGVAGFGRTVAEAAAAFDKAWRETPAPREQGS